MLCAKCWAAFEDSRISRVSTFNHRAQQSDLDLQVLHPGFDSLKLSLESGCNFCHRLVDASMSKQESKILSQSHGLRPDIDPGSFSLRYRFAYETASWKVISCTAILCAQKNGATIREKCRETLFLAPEQKPHPEVTSLEAENGVDSTSMDTIAYWIRHCSTEHAFCRKLLRYNSSYSFARILAVGDEPNGSIVMVCPSKDIPTDSQYMTLSHCWGSDVSSIPSLTTERYEEYLQRIEVAALPQTFQDAIRVARHLQIRFLWIDSLCIIQNSSQDWLEQAALMDEIYQGSYLNLAATKSTDPSGGLFTNRNIHTIAPLRVKFNGNVPEGVSLAEDKRPVTRISLKSNSNLVVSSVNNGLESVKTMVDFNDYLGNENGTFDTNGRHFGLSARNVFVSGTMLHAELQKRDGVWHPDSIDLRNVINGSSQWICVQNSDKYKASLFYDVGNDAYTKWSAQVTKAKLCTRGWVLQERILAPRVVHFAKQQLFWECLSSQALEERPSDEIDCRQLAARRTRLDFKTWNLYSNDLLHFPEPKQLGLNYIWSSVKAMHGRNHMGLRKEQLDQDPSLLTQAKHLCYGDDNWVPTHSIIKHWSKIVYSYSHTRLTYANDRLIAIAGLAKLLSKRTGIRYIAGLWAYQIPRQLLWSYANLRNGGDVQAEFVAPSWSWASDPLRGLSHGIEIEPSLEIKGAMDLVKVLSLDVEGILETDTMPFGRLKHGSLRVRGRLLPISLDPSLWPDGASRKDFLVQFWTGSTHEAPVGETFLVPVLFTRWNERFPPGTPNSLLLEATKDKGVFRRVGTARLSSLCDLKNVVPQLYNAKSSHHEDEDDDADTEDEAEDAKAYDSRNHVVQPNPQQELHDKMADMLASTGVEQSVLTLQRKLQERAVKLKGNPEGKQRVDAAMRTARLLSAVRNTALQSMPGRPGDKIKIDTQAAQAAVQSALSKIGSEGSNIKVVTRKHMWTPKEITKLEPKTAIGSHFYKEYIEDDEDVVRYGHFVFDII